MRSSVLASSRFGKFYPRSTPNLQSLELAACAPLTHLQFTITADRIYLLDEQGALTVLVLSDNSLATLPNLRLTHFQVEAGNCFSLCGVGKQAQLLQVGVESRRYTRVAALALTRVLSFQKNHLTNLLLVVDFQLALILDAHTGARVSALKATNGDTFSCGRFLDQNRLLVLAVRGKELRVVEILGMKTVERIRLPFEIKGIKLEATLDGSAVAVYGDSNMLLIVRVSPYGKLSYQMAELPVRSILCARFTYQNDLILLGADRVLYGLPHGSKRLVPLFNPEQKLRVSCFDVALDTKTIALAAGKTIHFLSLPQGVRKALMEDEGNIIEFSEQGGGENHLIMERQLDDGPKTKKVDITVLLQAATPSDLPDFSKETELQPEVQQVKGFKPEIRTANAIYLYLHKLEPSRRLVHLHKTEVIGLIHRLVRLLQNPSQAATAAYHILSQLGTAISDGSLDKFALILAPRVFERIQRAEGEFGQFSGKAALTLFSEYLSVEAQDEVLRTMVRNCHRENFLPIFLLCAFLQMRANSPTWPLPHQQSLRIAGVLTQTDNLMENPRHAYIFAKEAVANQEEVESEQLQALLARQEQLKSELQDLRRANS